MKKATFRGQVGFYHVTCVNWTYGAWFNPDNSEQIEGRVEEESFKQTCYYCRKVQGAIIQCDFKDCDKSFHVRCGIKDGLIQDWKIMDKQRTPKFGNVQKVFCK